MENLGFGPKAHVTVGGVLHRFRMMGPYEYFKLALGMEEGTKGDLDLIRACLLSVDGVQTTADQMKGKGVDAVVPMAADQAILAQNITEAHLKFPKVLDAYLDTLQMESRIAADGSPIRTATYNLPSTGKEVRLRVLGGFTSIPLMRKIQAAAGGVEERGLAVLNEGIKALRVCVEAIDDQNIDPTSMLGAGIDRVIPAAFDAQFLISAFFKLHTANPEALNASRETFGFDE